MIFVHDPEIDEFTDEQLLYALIQRNNLETKNYPWTNTKIHIGSGKRIVIVAHWDALKEAFGENF